MEISAENIAKKFRNEWIFHSFSKTFTLNNSYAIIGPNGSGKSTFVQALSGIIPLNKGNIQYSLDDQILDDSKWYKNISIAAPYQELIEEFTLAEFVKFHLQFKKLSVNSVQEFMEFVSLEKHKNKQIKYFSSGMKQRLKLGLCFCSDSKLLIFDEPTSNLDDFGINWYLNQIQTLQDRILIISSNDKKEYQFCNETIDILAYK